MTWIEAFSFIARLQDEELAIWRRLLLRETDANELQSWLDDHADDMNEEERSALERIVSHVRQARNQAQLLESIPGADRAADPTAELLAIQKQRAELLANLGKALNARGRSRKRRAPARDAKAP